MQQRFQSFGTVSNVDIIQDKFDPECNRNLAYCDLDFATDADQKKFFKTWNGVKWGNPQPMSVKEANPAGGSSADEQDVTTNKRKKWSPAVEPEEPEPKYWKKLKDGREVRSMRVRDPVQKWKIRLHDPMKMQHKFYPTTWHYEESSQKSIPSSSESCKPKQTMPQSIVDDLAGLSSNFSFGDQVEPVIPEVSEESTDQAQDLLTESEEEQSDTVQQSAEVEQEDTVSDHESTEAAPTSQFTRAIDLSKKEPICETAADVVDPGQKSEIDSDKSKMMSVLDGMFNKVEPVTTEAIPIQTAEAEDGFLKRNQIVQITRVVRFDPQDYGIVQDIPQAQLPPSPSQSTQPELELEPLPVLKKDAYQIDLNQMHSLFQKDKEAAPEFELFQPQTSSDPFAELIQSVKEERIVKAQQQVTQQHSDLAEQIARTSPNVSLFFCHVDSQDSDIRSRSVYHQNYVEPKPVSVEEMSERWKQTRAVFTDSYKLRRKQALKQKRRLQKIK